MSNKARKAENTRIWRLNNPERAKAIAKKYRDKSVEARRAAHKSWYEENRQSVLERRRRPENRAKEREAFSAWQKANRAKRTEAQRVRVAQMGAFPLTQGQRDAVREVYDEARRVTAETGIPHEVDHAVPLKGLGICGLHVPWNLRVITAVENRQKNAKWTETDALPAWPHALDLVRTGR